MNGPLALDAESLYQAFLEGGRPLLTPQTHLVGITSGGHGWPSARTAIGNARESLARSAPPCTATTSPSAA